jgi:hypothetical protein
MTISFVTCGWETHDQLLCDLWSGNLMTNFFVTCGRETPWPTSLWLVVRKPHDQLLCDLWLVNHMTDSSVTCDWEPHDQLLYNLWSGNPMINSFVTYVCRTPWPTPLWLEVDEPHDQFLFDLWSGNPWPFLKGILSTSCVIFSYPKLLSISVLTFIKWRLTPSYVAKDTIFW